MKKFSKILSSNDVGETSSHQVGVHIPKTGVTPLKILPILDSKVKNPCVWIEATDPHERVWKLRFIYYNSKLHPQIDDNGVKKGTRNEYRVTHITKFFSAYNAKCGDFFILTKKEDGSYYVEITPYQKEPFGVIRLAGWRAIH